MQRSTKLKVKVDERRIMIDKQWMIAAKWSMMGVGDW
jgi:hypothetical protein